MTITELYEKAINDKVKEQLEEIVARKEITKEDVILFTEICLKRIDASEKLVMDIISLGKDGVFASAGVEDKMLDIIKTYFERILE